MLLLVGVLCAALVGCSDNATAPDKAVPTPAQTADIPEAVTVLLDENTVSDMRALPDADWPWEGGAPYELARHCDVYAVTFIWGSFNTAATPNANLIDWTGSAYVNAVGALHVHRTIDFEDGEDYLVPTDVPTKAAWVSKTSSDVDGVSLLLFVRNDIPTFAAPWLTFETAPIRLEYGLDKLVDLKEFHVLDNGAALAVLARKIWPGRCSGGFMEGKWLQQDLTAGTGRLEGLWLSYYGDTLGIMIGQYWTTDDGQRLLEGWVSGFYTDQIIAYLKGKWWYDDPRMCPSPWCGTGHGWFAGQFRYADGSNTGGVFKAEFGDFMDPATDVASLPYRGVWFLHCPWTQSDIGADITNDAP